MVVTVLGLTVPGMIEKMDLDNGMLLGTTVALIYQ